MLCLTFMKEEETYWMLHAMIEKVLPADYYMSGMAGVQTDTAVLKQVRAADAQY